MRPEYLANTEEHPTGIWIPEHFLLPNFVGLLHEFNVVQGGTGLNKLHLASVSQSAKPMRKALSKASAQATPESKQPGELPPFVPLSAPTFKWGSRDGADFAIENRI